MGAIEFIPKAAYAVICGALLAVIVVMGFKVAGVNSDLSACRADTAQLAKSNATLEADKATLQSSIADQNQRITELQADAAAANLAADRAAGAYRESPERDIPKDLTPAAVNQSVRQRIEELVP